MRNKIEVAFLSYLSSSWVGVGCQDHGDRVARDGMAGWSWLIGFLELLYLNGCPKKTLVTGLTR